MKRQERVVIIGGGNSAGQAAMYLSRHARRTHIVVRGSGLADTMSSYLSDRIENDPRIQLWTRTEVCELDGDDRAPVSAALLDYFAPAAEHLRNDTGLPISGPGDPRSR